MKIGNLKLENNLVLAPMLGVNCVAFRLLCKKHGAGLVSTPMIHPESIGKQELDLIKEERPVLTQIIGKDPDMMADAARALEEKSDIIDINLGCPDAKELARHTGGFLIKHPEQFEKMVAKVVSSVSCPVSAKIRIGWDDQSLNHVKVAKSLENLGISAIAVHGRTVKQSYTGKANWTAIKQVKEKVNIPVIANGDVFGYSSYKAVLDMTGADFVMVGRAAVGNPMIFSDLLKAKDTNKDMAIAKQVFSEFLDYYSKYSIRETFSEIKQHALWIVKGVKNSGFYKNEIAKAKNIEEIKKYF